MHKLSRTSISDTPVQQAYMRMLTEYRDNTQRVQTPLIDPDKLLIEQLNQIKQKTHRKVLSTHIPRMPKLQLDILESKYKSPRFKVYKQTSPSQQSTARSYVPTTNSAYKLQSKKLMKQPYFPNQPTLLTHMAKIIDFKESQNKVEIAESPKRKPIDKSTKSSEFKPCSKFLATIDQLPKPPNSIHSTRSPVQYKLLMLKAIKKMKQLNLNPQKVAMEQVFSKKPYQKEHAQEFIHAVKLNQIIKAEQYLQKCKYLVYDFDYFNMTALHWACKKGLYEMCEMLIKNLSDVDVIDVLNRTPLSLAIENNHYNIVELLLKNEANPWSTTVTDLKSIVQDNHKIQKLLTQTRRIQIINSWGDTDIIPE